MDLATQAPYLKAFVANQIVRLKSCYFNRGVRDKVQLLETVHQKIIGGNYTDEIYPSHLKMRS